MTIWDDLDPDAYFGDNYRVPVRSFDRELLRLTADHWVKHRPVGHALDLGTGANLYPALAMLPWARTVTLMEPGARNIEWLRGQIDQLGFEWLPYYYDLLAQQHPLIYKRPDPAAFFAAKARVVGGEAGDLHLRARGYGLGTMFFMAESSTDSMATFDFRTRCFVNALKPGAPFAAAFMRGSGGYSVGGIDFPAVAIYEEDVDKVLSEVASGVDIYTIEVGSDALRSGYEGMMLAVGRAL